MIDLEKCRKKIIRWAYERQTGHWGSALSVLPLVAEAWAKIGRCEATGLVLSKAHAAAALRAVAEAGGHYIPDNVPMHTDWSEPYVTWSGGSLGNPIGAAVGRAMAMRELNITAPLIVICGDGELQEGIAHEAIMFAREQNLPIEFWLDRNSVGGFGEVRWISLMDKCNRIFFSEKSLRSHYVPPSPEEFPWLTDKNS